MGTPLDITSFDLKNSNGKAVIYRTPDPSLNLLAFAIINTTGADLPLTGGAPDVGSTFTIDFSSILPDPVVQGLAIALPAGWASRFEPGTETEPPAWSLAPSIDLTLKPDDRVNFDISKIVLESYDSGNFEIQWSKVPGQSDSTSPRTIWVGIINPPDPKKKHLTLHYGYTNVSHTINNQSFSEPDGKVIDAAADGTPVEIFITYDTKALIFNGFTYYLTNSSADKIPADPTPGSGTVLSISFLIGELSYDITNRERAVNQMTLGVASKEPPWKLDAKTPGSGLITFTFKPGSDVFVGGNQTLYLDVQAIITVLNVDPGTISTMYAQINNVPGYNDAVFPLALEKKVAVASDKLTATPTTIDLGKPVTLTWVTELAKRATIEWKDRKGNSILLDSDKGQIPLNSKILYPDGFPILPTAATTVFLLSAYDNSPTPNQQERTITVIEPPPRILSFSSDRRLINLTGETEINLSWKLNDNVRTLTLEALGVDYSVTGQSSYPYKITTSTVFKLKAYGYDPEHPDPATSKITVLAYEQGASLEIKSTKPARQNLPVVLASRVNGYLYALDAGTNSVFKFDNGTPLGSNGGTVMALSPKETKLFLFNPGYYNTVWMVDLRCGAQSEPMPRLPLTAMVCNDSDTLLCCALAGTPGTVALLAIDPNANSFAQPTYIQVGGTLFSMVFNDDCSMLYVANFPQCISLIRLSDRSVTNVALTAFLPNSMVYHKALKRLFVACEYEDGVAMIELSKNNAVTYIKVGTRPSQLLLNQDKLYVANSGGNTVSVIDAASGLVEASLTVGEGPMGMALYEDFNLLFVCNYCSRTLSVVDLVGNHVLPEQLPTGKDSGNPFGLVCWEGRHDVKIFVGKEDYPHRRQCSAPTPNTSLSVAVYSIEKP